MRTEAVVLLLEGGAGARQTRLLGDDLEREGIAVVTGELAWNLSRTSNFNQLVFVEHGENNTLTESLSALTLSIGGGFSAKLSYEVTRNSDPPAGARDTDVTGTVTLVYAF